MKKHRVVGHAPRKLSTACLLFHCTVSGARSFSADLPPKVPCNYVRFLSQKIRHFFVDAKCSMGVMSLLVEVNLAGIKFSAP